MRSPVSLRAMLIGACLLGAATFSGCDPHRGIEVTETDEVQYRRGQQMLRSQQNPIALEAFLKVIDKRDGDAPESHLEAGRIYLTHLSDPYAAIYHFRRYLQLRPNSTQAPMVRQLVETAMKESIKGLPGNAMSSEVDRLDLLDMVEKLKRENANLRTELERAGRVATTPQTLAQTSQRTAQAAPRSSAPVAGSQSRPAAASQQPDVETVPVDDFPVQPLIPLDTTPAPSQASVRQAPQRPNTATAPARAGRSYTVQPKDTLYGISAKVYGSGSRWREIYDANRDRMSNERDLKIGMELRIP